MEFKEYKIDEFLKDLASDSQSPGGGSVAGFVAALAGGLNSMVYSLTINKKCFEKMTLEEQKVMLDYKEASNKFINKSVLAMEKDRNAFIKLMNCYKMKKDTDEEKNLRNKMIAEKTIVAMKAPYDLTKEAYKFYDNIDIAVKYGNKMLVSDAVCAAILLNAAIEAAIENVKINLKYISNEDYVLKISNEIFDIKKKSEERKEKVIEEAKNR